MLKDRGTPLVMGLRDVMDDPDKLAAEWERKNIVPALGDLYDEIWVYGLPQINKPLTGIEAPPSVRHKMVYTGYLHRDLPLHTDVPHEAEEIDGPFILVTPGGGGDGVELVDWVLARLRDRSAHSLRRGDRVRPVHAGRRARGLQGTRREVPNIRTLTFDQQSRGPDEGCRGRGGDGRLQHLLRDPVLRQAGDHRAAHPAPAGAVHPHPGGAQPRPARDARGRAGRDPHTMATALRQLPQQGLPSDVVVPGLLDGVGNVMRLVHKQLANPHRGPASLYAAETEGTAGAPAASPPSARFRS